MGGYGGTSEHLEVPSRFAIYAKHESINRYLKARMEYEIL